jgi:hypothetical protein
MEALGDIPKRESHVVGVQRTTVVPVEFPRFSGHLIACVVKTRKDVFAVPRTRPVYPEEFRREAVELLLAGRSPSELAQSLGSVPADAAQLASPGPA